MTIAIKVVCIAIALFSSAPAFGQEVKAPAAPEDREPVTVEIEGLVLEYVPRQLGRGRKTARAEMEALCSADARIEVEKPIGYRRDRLSEGEYSIRVEREESGAAFLVVEPTPSAGGAAKGDHEEGNDGKGGQAKEEGGNGDDSAEEAEVKPRATKDGDALDAREKKKSSRSSESAGKRASEAAHDGGKAKVKAKRGQSPEEKAGKAEDAEPNLRLPLKFAPCEKSGDLVSFALVSRGKSGRFFISLRAGGTEARSPTIRFVEE